MAPSQKPVLPSPAVLAFYNALPSVFWSGVCLVPLTVFCYQHLARPWLYGFVAASLLAYALPRAWFRYWQLSSRPVVYRRLGVRVVGHFTQQGTLLNRLVRRQYPTYRHLRGRRAGPALLANSYHQERFHVAMLLFFLFTILYAAAHGYWGWAALLTLLNGLYNVYPIWLQQYLRVRLGAAGRLPTS